MSKKRDEDELEELEEQLKTLEEADNQEELVPYGSPEPEKKESVFKFFKELLGFPETWKVGNLKNTEIGMPRHSIRKLLRLARYSHAEGLSHVEKYFVKEAQDIAATSMGRKGFYPQIVVTQIRKEQKVKEPTPEKKGWFSKKTEGEENEQ